MKWIRWLVPLVVVASALAAILGAVDGDPLVAFVFGLSALVNVGQLAINPATRPKSVARSLKASRRIVAQSG